MAGGYVQVADSLFHGITGSTKVQLAQCYRTLMDDFGNLEVEIPPVQIQTGSVDCGLFAIAFAYELASGKQVLKEVCFDQTKMRSHLLSCFENGELTAFPYKRRRPYANQREHNGVTIKTFCQCRLPEEYDNMVKCDDCRKWFHQKCVEYTCTQTEWLCPSCTPPPAKKLKCI